MDGQVLSFTGNEPSVSISRNYRLDPVQNRYPGIKSFKEAMILPPTQLKQVLNISETQNEETTSLLTKIWQSMANVLAEANRVFIICYSFPSTDHHFRKLMRQVNRQRKYQKYEKIFCCAMADGTEGETFANANRFFPSDCFRPYDQGFEAFVLQPSA